MDDTNQIPSQNQANAQAQPQAQPLPGQTQAPIQQPQGGSVGSLVKEHGPVVTDDLRRSGIEPEVHPELEKIGVKSVPEFPTVGPSERKVGISPAGESVPVEPSGIVHPSIMTEEEAKQELKHENPTNSNWGYLALFVKLFKSIHHSLTQNSKSKSQNYLAKRDLAPQDNSKVKI